MTRPHQLETTLRSLGLSGMLDTVEARLAQAHAGELGHVEFLQALCEDEVSRRDAAGIVRRVRAARFEQTSSIEDFDFTYNPKVPAALIRDLATLRFVEAGESVIIHGPVGVGKTMIAQALGHQACRRGHSALFTRPPGYWPTSPADTPIAPGTFGSSAGPDRPSSLWTTTPCVTSPCHKPTTSMSSSPSEPPRPPSSRPTGKHRTGTPCSRIR